MSHLRLLRANGVHGERRRPRVEITKEGCRMAWLVLPMAASAAQPARAAAARRKPRTALRRISIAVFLAALMTAGFNVIAAVGIQGVLSRAAPNTSIGGKLPMWGLRDGQG